MQFEGYALKSNAGDFASRSKAKAKPQRRISASSSTKTLPIGERPWTDIEPQEYSLSDSSVSKKLTNLLRHGSLPREDDGAIEFWRIKDYLRNHFVYSQHWSDKKWKSSMARGGGNKKRFQYWTDSSGTILYLRALQGHSGRNLVDPSLQDTVLIPDGFFKYIYHVGCAINLHSIINSGLIPGGQNLSKRQTVFFLPMNPMDKEHKDTEKFDLEAPRLARYMHKARKKHQNTVYWVHIKVAQKKGLMFYQTRSNAIVLYNTLPTYFIPKVVRVETGDIIHEKGYESPRTPPKISLRHDWMKELGSEVARQAEVNQPTQPNPNPNHDRTVRPVVTEQTSRSSAQELDTRFSRDCKNTNLFVERLDKDKDTDKNVDADHGRTGRPAVIGQPTGSSSTFNEVDIDFRASGLPHAVVKQAENSRVRELVKKIENHPHRQALQDDLQQNNAYNLFSEKSKQMIHDMGNGELSELCETISKSAMQRMPSLLESRHRLLHLRASLGRESIQPRCPPMDNGSSLNPELCH